MSLPMAVYKCLICKEFTENKTHCNKETVFIVRFEKPDKACIEWGKRTVAKLRCEGKTI